MDASSTLLHRLDDLVHAHTARTICSVLIARAALLALPFLEEHAVAQTMRAQPGSVTMFGDLDFGTTRAR
ncbi:MAG TPA: hypothetical protein VMV45_06720 [Casimicrobiaceae bacterium]|nr:hypothetical protein [Casimicrobiaceae bacterium]